MLDLVARDRLCSGQYDPKLAHLGHHCGLQCLSCLLGAEGACSTVRSFSLDVLTFISVNIGKFNEALKVMSKPLKSVHFYSHLASDFIDKQEPILVKQSPVLVFLLRH